MKLRTVLVLLVLALAGSVHAADLAGANILLPIAGRTGGAFGSQWQTDLVITNLEADPVPLTLTFYGADGQYVASTTTLWGNGTMAIEDVLLKAFDMPNSSGMIRVSSTREDARVTARAYIVNRGNATGEYGQGVPGVPVDGLATDHVLSGIAKGDNRRTNIGIANPWAMPASVTLALHGAEGQQLGTIHRIVPAFEVLQINDAFAAFEAEPSVEASVRVTSQVGVYAYASIVRNDSGDAVFVPGTGVGGQTAPVAPRCAEPASLISAKKEQEVAEGWVVMMQPETSFDDIMNALPTKHGYNLLDVYHELPGFAAELTPSQIAALRCEASVLFIQQNVVSLP
jgi:hypothetical protein